MVMAGEVARQRAPAKKAALWEKTPKPDDKHDCSTGNRRYGNADNQPAPRRLRPTRGTR
jgi:hypothetical protein